MAHKLAMRLSAAPRHYLGGLDIAWVAMADNVRWVNPHPLGTKNSGMRLDRQHYSARMPTSINKPTLNRRPKHRLACFHPRIQYGAIDQTKRIEGVQKDNDAQDKHFNAWPRVHQSTTP